MGGLLAGAGHGRGATVEHAHSRRVAVWRVERGAEVLATTLDLPAPANCVAIRGDARQLAVGAGDGVVRVYRTADWSAVVALGLPTACGDDAVHCLDYSPDGGERLAAGYKRGVFAVFDVASGAAVRRIDRAALSASEGLIASFAPAGDVLVLGGSTSNKVVLVELAPAPVHTASMPRAGELGAPATLGGAAFGGGRVALAAGSRLVVRTGAGCGDSNGGPSTVLMDVDVGDTLQGAGDFKSPVVLRPVGLHVAGITKTKGVTVRAVRTGDEVFALGPWRGRPGCSSGVWDACLN